jgi:hypothetical protein
MFLRPYECLGGAGGSLYGARLRVVLILRGLDFADWRVSAVAP